MHGAVDIKQLKTCEKIFLIPIQTYFEKLLFILIFLHADTTLQGIILMQPIILVRVDILNHGIK
jgi:hypothetical protein